MNDDIFDVKDYLPGGKFGPKHHLKKACRAPDVPCPRYNSCDIDIQLCKSNDIIPILSRIIVNKIEITGQAASLLNYVMSQGYTLSDVLDNKVNATAEMKQLALSALRNKNIIPDFPISPAYRFVHQTIEYNIHLWPQRFRKETRLLLNFFTVLQQYYALNLLNRVTKAYHTPLDLNKIPLGDYSIVTEQLNPKNPAIINGLIIRENDPFLKCLHQTLTNSGIVNPALILDNIILSRKNIPEKLPDNHYIAIFSFGYHSLLETTFHGERINIPLPSGSLISFYSDRESTISQLTNLNTLVDSGTNINYKSHPQYRVNLIYIFRIPERPIIQQIIKSDQQLINEINNQK